LKSFPSYLSYINPIIVEFSLLIGLLFLTYLLLLLKEMVNRQIDNEIKGIIPIKAIRKRIGIKIKWK